METEIIPAIFGLLFGILSILCGFVVVTKRRYKEYRFVGITLIIMGCLIVTVLMDDIIL